MNVMAVTTLDAVMKHFGLSEGTHDVVFVTYLAVGKVNGLIDRLQRKVLVKVTPRRKSFFDF